MFRLTFKMAIVFDEWVCADTVVLQLPLDDLNASIS
jgi:hypothetical protein